MGSSFMCRLEGLLLQSGGRNRRIKCVGRNKEPRRGSDLTCWTPHPSQEEPSVQAAKMNQPLALR